MASIRIKNLRKVKGIIVWDFDGVLFEMERYRQDSRRAYINLGIPEEIILDILAGLHKRKENFSIARFIQELRKRKVGISGRKIYKVNHTNLEEGDYYSPKMDALLYRLNRIGFRQMLLSFGSAPYQRKKMFFGCSAFFPKHFAKIMITSRPKYFMLLRVKKKYQNTPLIFIDNTKKNLELAQIHVLGVRTIHYSNLSGVSLKNLEKKILLYAEK